MTNFKTKCPQCKRERMVSRSMMCLIGRGVNTGKCKSCSLKGNKYRLGTHHSPETREKMSLAALGKAKTEMHRRNISLAKSGVRVEKISGRNHYLWIEDRTLLKDDHLDRGGSRHREWSRSVKNRDGWVCKISNGDCSGQVVAHHILPWRDYVELRYEVNNGITLCHFHHPRKRNDEMRLSPYFQELVKTN